MPKSKIKFRLILPALAALIIGLTLVVVSSRPTVAATSLPSCSGVYLMTDGIIATSPTTLSSGLHQLSLSNTAGTVIQSVSFIIDNTTLGRGRADVNLAWGMPWYTQVATSASHQIGATVVSSTSTGCSVPAMTVTTSNSVLVPPTPPTVAPTYFYGQTNQVIPFALKNLVPLSTSGTPAPADVTAYTVFQKGASSLGLVSPQDTSNLFNFSAGPTAGVGSINVYASYGGAPTTLITIPVTVYAPVAPIPAPSPTVTSGTTTATTTTAPAATTSPALPAATPIEAALVTKTCVLTGLTELRYQAISSGTARPTAAEFEAINKCFADSNYVLPTSFVPIAPDKVKLLTQASDVKIAGATNQIKKTNKTSVTTLKFAGKAKPSSTVILYVHSEPLVLSTQADKNGDWNYALEDPLAAGKHEVYAVVNKGDGTYQRSSPFDFVIAKAEASPLNPKGYGLKIESIKPTATENNRPTNIYVAASIALVALVLGALTLALRAYKKHQAVNVVVGLPTQPIETGSPFGPLAPMTVVTPTSTPVIIPLATPTPAPAPAPETATVLAAGTPTIIVPDNPSASPEERYDS